MAKHVVYLALGSNLGDRHGNLRHAVDEIEPWGFVSDNVFTNAAVCVETTLTPRQLLETTQSIERCMGRKVKSTDGHYHDRIIDIDILLYDDVHMDEPDLKIPHPLMHERPFVMEPLREIMP